MTSTQMNSAARMSYATSIIGAGSHPQAVHNLVLFVREVPDRHLIMHYRCRRRGLPHVNILCYGGVFLPFV